jgi:hypothetical protein
MVLLQNQPSQQQVIRTDDQTSVWMTTYHLCVESSSPSSFFPDIRGPAMVLVLTLMFLIGGTKLTRGPWRLNPPGGYHHFHLNYKEELESAWISSSFLNQHLLS